MNATSNTRLWSLVIVAIALFCLDASQVRAGSAEIVVQVVDVTAAPSALSRSCVQTLTRHVRASVDGASVGRPQSVLRHFPQGVDVRTLTAEAARPLVRSESTLVLVQSEGDRLSLVVITPDGRLHRLENVGLALDSDAGRRLLRILAEPIREAAQMGTPV